MDELHVTEFASVLRGLLCDIDELLESMDKYDDLCKKYKRVFIIKDRLLDLVDDLVYASGNDPRKINYTQSAKFKNLIINSLYNVEYPEDYFNKLCIAVQKYKIEYKELRRDVNKDVVKKADLALFKKVCIGTICGLGTITVCAIVFSKAFANKTFKAEKDNKYSNSIITTATPSKKVSSVTTTTSKQTYNKIDSLDDYNFTTTVTTNIPTTTTTTFPKVTETESTTTTTVVPETTIPETSSATETSSITETTISTTVVTEEPYYTETKNNNEFFVAPDGSIWESEEDYLEYMSEYSDNKEYSLHF